MGQQQSNHQKHSQSQTAPVVQHQRQPVQPAFSPRRQPIQNNFDYSSRSHDVISARNQIVEAAPPAFHVQDHPAHYPVKNEVQPVQYEGKTLSLKVSNFQV